MQPKEINTVFGFLLFMLFRLPEKSAWFKDYDHTYYCKEKDLGEVTDKVHAEAEEETNDKTSHNASHHALHASHN